MYVFQFDRFSAESNTDNEGLFSKFEEIKHRKTDWWL